MKSNENKKFDVAQFEVLGISNDVLKGGFSTAMTGSGFTLIKITNNCAGGNCGNCGVVATTNPNANAIN